MAVRCSTDEMANLLSGEIFEDSSTTIRKENNKTSYEAVRIWGLPKSQLNSRCIGGVQAAPRKTLRLNSISESQDMTTDVISGVGITWTGRLVLTSMIFVPGLE